MLTVYDQAVLAFYFAFLILVAYVTRSFISDTKDFFQGSGSMMWWMTGTSAFMGIFSAWTFTGAAGEIYLNGPMVTVIFLGNALGFFANYLFFAERFRRMRVVTAMQAVKQRYGKSGEQFFTWLMVPVGILYAGIWLMGLGIFISSLFGISLELTIMVSGAVIVLSSVLSGNWGVVSTDFIQATLLMLIAILVAVFSLIEVGGPGEFISKLPNELAVTKNFNLPAVLVAWTAAMLVSQFLKMNHMLDASKYLNANDGTTAKRAALLAAALFIVGPVIWFIPPLAAKMLYPDLATHFPSLKNPAEGAYLAVALHALPNGMIGLLVVGIFAATMSSMDSGLNRNAGIFVKNVYVSLLRKAASEREQLLVGKLATLIIGSVIILFALYYSTLKNIGLFDLMIQVGALLSIPIAVPLFWGMLIKKTPRWSGWSTACIGLLCSAMMKYGYNADWFAHTLDLNLSSHDIRYWNQTASVFVNVTIPTIWFFFTSLFYKARNECGEDLKVFWVNQSTQLAEGLYRHPKSRQGSMLGALSAIYGIFVAALCIIPNSLIGRLTYVGVGCILVCLGAILYISTREKKVGSVSSKPSHGVLEASPG